MIQSIQQKNEFNRQATQQKNEFDIQATQTAKEFTILAKQSERDFKIQAAQIVMDTNQPDIIKGKAAALATLFPEYLPEDFAASFKPENFSRPSDELRVALMQILWANKNNRQEIIEKVNKLWKQ